MRACCAPRGKFRPEEGKFRIRVKVPECARAARRADWSRLIRLVQITLDWIGLYWIRLIGLYADTHIPICRYTYTHMQVYIYKYVDTHIPICKYTYTHMQTHLLRACPCVMHAARTLAQIPIYPYADTHIPICRQTSHV